MYALIVPFGNIHVDHDADSIQGGSHMKDRFVKGKGLTRKLCVAAEDEEDYAEAKRWAENSAMVYVPEWEIRHGGCIYDSERSPRKWPFALLFVCQQTYQELVTTLYEERSFSFNDFRAFKAFAAKVPSQHIAQIRDLRFSLHMGSGGDGLDHHDHKGAVAACRHFTGLRRLHAALQLRFYDVRHLRDTARTDWKVGHWARGLLNFACHPLEEVTVVLENDDIHKITSDNMMAKHNPEHEELQEWAVQIRDQLLAPWDRVVLLAFLYRNYQKEIKYHTKICGNHWDYKSLGFPEERVP